MGIFDFLTGGSAHTPVEAPNSLQSNSILRIVDVISEGEIEGLVNGLKSVYLDQTRVQNDNGSFNYQKVAIETRNGTVSQTPVLGFSDVETEISVGAEVKYGIPVVRTVTDTDATSARVTIEVPSLSQTNSSTGDTVQTFVYVSIEVQPNAGSYTTVVNDTIAGKTTSPYERSYKFTLPGTGPWNIRVNRLSPDSTSSFLNNKTFWASYTEIEDFQFSYPYTALAGVQFDAQSFGGSVPLRTYLVKGLKISVPANYDPATRAYATSGTGTTGGIWDGTFKTAWTDNPAWVFYDLLTNNRYGLGQFITSGSVDKFALYDIAQYCDELIPNGFGATEPRYTFNGVIASTDDALKVLGTIASVFHGMAFWGSSGVFATADMPADPVKLITPANVIGGIINYQGGALKARHSAVNVTWYNPDNLYKTDVEVVEDAAAIALFGYRVQNLTAFGCTSRGQAIRMGKWLLDTEKHENENASWSASWDQADLLPGQIVEIADPAYSGLDFGGRISAAASKLLTLDRPVTLESGKTYSIDVVLPDGSIAGRAITTGASTTTTVAFDTALASLPIVGAVWVITSSTVAPRKFKVLSRDESDKHVFAFTAVLHDDTKYDRIELGLTIEPPSFTALQIGPIAAPTALTSVESIALGAGGIPAAKVGLSWTAAADPRVIRYEIQDKPPNQDWQAVDTTPSVSYDIFGLIAGDWGFRVRSIDALGSVSPWLSVEATVIDGMLLPPDDLENVRAAYVDGVMNIRWDEIPDFRQVKYEIRKGDAWESGATVGVVLHPPFESHGDATYWVAAYIGPDAGPRTYAVNPSEIAVSGSLISANVLATWDEAATGWTGVFGGTGGVDVDLNAARTGGSANILDDTDVLDDDDVLNLGGDGDATYEIPPSHYVNIGRVAPCPITIEWKSVGVPILDNILDLTDILVDVDVLGADQTRFIDVYPEIAVSQSDATNSNILDLTDVLAENDMLTAGILWAPYQKFSPGTYVGHMYKSRAQIKTTDPNTIGYLESFVFTVDVPDRLDHLTGVTVPAVGLPVTFTPDGSATPAAFNGGPGSATVPNVQVTIHDAQSGDVLTISSRTLSGCTLAITNGGSPVQRNNVDVLIQGY